MTKKNTYEISYYELISCDCGHTTKEEESMLITNSEGTLFKICCSCSSILPLIQEHGPKSDRLWKLPDNIHLQGANRDLSSYVNLLIEQHKQTIISCYSDHNTEEATKNFLALSFPDRLKFLYELYVGTDYDHIPFSCKEFFFSLLLKTNIR